MSSWAKKVCQKKFKWKLKTIDLPMFDSLLSDEEREEGKKAQIVVRGLTYDETVVIRSEVNEESARGTLIEKLSGPGGPELIKAMADTLDAVHQDTIYYAQLVVQKGIVEPEMNVGDRRQFVGKLREIAPLQFKQAFDAIMQSIGEGQSPVGE
jgi:hypothetical protein